VISIEVDFRHIGSLNRDRNVNLIAPENDHQANVKKKKERVTSAHLIANRTGGLNRLIEPWFAV